MAELEEIASLNSLREVEFYLRDHGLSRRQAKAVISCAINAGDPDDQEREIIEALKCRGNAIPA